MKIVLYWLRIKDLELDNLNPNASFSTIHATSGELFRFFNALFSSIRGYKKGLH